MKTHAPLSETHDKIGLRRLAVPCCIGILPEERLRPQRLEVDVELWLPLETAARTGDLAATVDYAALTSEIFFLIEQGRFRLLETAAEALTRLVFSHPLLSSVERVRVELRKPEALCGLGTPSIALCRLRSAAIAREGAAAEGAPFAYAGPDGRFAWRRLIPGETSQLVAPPRFVTVGLARGEGLLCDGSPAPSLTAWALSGKTAMSWKNGGASVGWLLCLERPAEKGDGGFLLTVPGSEDQARRFDYRLPSLAKRGNASAARD